MTIDLWYYASNDQERLLAVLGAHLDPALQDGFIAGTHERLTAAATNERNQRRLESIFLTMLSISALSFAAAWSLGFGVIHLAMSVVNAGAAGWLLRMRRSRADAVAAPDAKADAEANINAESKANQGVSQ